MYEYGTENKVKSKVDEIKISAMVCPCVPDFAKHPNFFWVKNMLQVFQVSQDWE